MSDVRTSILEMARGAFMEAADREMERVVDNILDDKTRPTAKRKVTLTIELQPDESRQMIGVSVTVAAKLAPQSAIETMLCVASDENGEAMMVETVPQVPGQISIGGEEQGTQKILKMGRD